MSRESFKSLYPRLPAEYQDDVVEAISNFHDVTVEALDNNLRSIHLCGSIAMGDFHPTSSDIDFLTVTHEAVSSVEMKKLKLGYGALRESGAWWDTRTEGVYLPESFCSNPSSDAASYPVLKTTGDFILSQPRSDWIIQLKTADAHGVRLFDRGDSEQLTSEISPRLLRETVLRGAMPFIKEPESGVQSRRVTALHVLSACRLGFTFATGEIASKPAAAEWAKENFPEYSTVIEDALLNRGVYEEGSVGLSYEFIDVVNESLSTSEDLMNTEKNNDSSNS